MMIKAEPIVNRRVILAEDAFAEIVIWRLEMPVLGSTHLYKYRLAYIVEQECVLRYDNERGKGDHLHWGSLQFSYHFSSIDQLLHDFQNEIMRWNDEHGRA
jgi:hypothetical protein